MRSRFIGPLLVPLFLALPFTYAQTGTTPAGKTSTKSSRTATRAPRKPAPPAPARKLSARKKFVLDVVQSAVGLPQGDPQDRLRVLVSAAEVVTPVEPKLAKSFVREGTQIESQLIASGQTPAVSMMQRGRVDCASALDFVNMLPVTSVPQAEQSLLGAVSSCPRQTLEPTKRKLSDALEQGLLAPRALLAVMETSGMKSQWSQEKFEAMFAALPKDAEKLRTEAPNLAAMFARGAPEVSPEIARKTGLNFLEWLGRLQEGSERNLAVNITSDALRQALGEEKYRDALASNVMAMQVAQTAGQAGEIERPQEESVSVLRALDSTREDRSEALRELPSSLRAREAAAHGFATGTSGDRKAADRYFDMAFAAVNEVWEQRSEQADASAVVEEVSEAAAHVDPVTALKRTQRLQDSTAQAIGMLAVARVVLAKQDVDRPQEPQAARRPRQQ